MLIASRLRVPLTVVVASGVVGALCSAIPATAASAPPSADGRHASAAAAVDHTLDRRTGPVQKNTVLIVTHDHATTQARMGSMLKAERATLGMTVRDSLPSINAVSVQVPTAKAQSVAARLRRQAGVSSVEVTVPRRFQFTPTDHLFATTQASYLGASGVNATTAWDTQKGSSSVKIAILDSGINSSNPDLAGKIAGTFDADANLAGVDIPDDVGHGTFVAGVAAANTNNGIGVAGAGFNSSILAVKIADPEGNIQIDDEVRGIQWAVENGAKIINLSIGDTSKSAAEASAIVDAQAAGVLVVAAAGNEGDIGDPAEYPAGDPGVLSVGATDAAGHRAPFSEYGSWVKVGAPGVNIESTTSPGSEFFPGAGYYGNGSGTSFSSPIVAGEAALLWARSPTSSAGQIMAAIVNSAHGYAGLSLGHGQVDFAAALQHIAPSTTPTITAPASVGNSADAVVLAATSSAKAVQFKVNDVAVGAPVLVSGGSAHTTWAAFGQADGTYTVTAADCTQFSECNPALATSTFSLVNTVPTVTSPTSNFTGTLHLSANAPDGGGVAFYVDGSRVGFDASGTASVYSAVASAPVDGPHTIKAKMCNAAGTVCNGTASEEVLVSSQSLHPTLGSYAPNPFSPNADGVNDRTATSITIPAGPSQTAYLTVLNSAGTTVFNKGSYGLLAPGAHTISWNGASNNGSTITGGVYTVIIETSEVGTSAMGSNVRTVTIDVTAPKITSVTGNGRTFYPPIDGYLDNFVPTAVLSENVTLYFVATTSTGAGVRTISAARAAGLASMTWTGYSTTGHLPPAGTYKWHLTAVDAAGNKSYSPTYSVIISLKKLVAKTTHVVVSGNSATDKIEFGDPSHSCVFYADGSFQNYTNGLDLLDQCSQFSVGVQFSAALYKIAVPSATIYTSLSMVVTGTTISGSAVIYNGFYFVSPTRLPTGEIKYPQRGLYETSTATHSYAMGAVSGSFHVSSDHHVYTEFDVSNEDNNTFNDFDIASLNLTVNYKVLQ